jgi:hypothetical protein
MLTGLVHIQQFPSLRECVQEEVRDDRTAKNFLVVKGTLPILFILAQFPPQFAQS